MVAWAISSMVALTLQSFHKAVTKTCQTLFYAEVYAGLKGVQGEIKMKEWRIKPYGSWESPITSDLIVAGTVGLGQPLIDGDDIYWVEMRPTEGGRSVIVKRDLAGRIADVTPP